MKKVCELKPGTLINYAKKKFVVLGKRRGGVLCLLAQSKKNAAFYDGNEKPYNDYRKSDLRKYIEGEFLEELFKNGAKKEDLVPFNVNLRDIDSSEGYGIVEGVLAAPLTLWDYGKFKHLIPKDSEWWLASPMLWSRSPYCSGVDSGIAFTVTSSGGSDSWGVAGSCGVRPALVLNSSLLVSYEGEEEDIDLTKVQNEAFLEEVKRRWKQGMFTIQVNGPYIDFEGV